MPTIMIHYHNIRHYYNGRWSERYLEGEVELGALTMVREIIRNGR